MKSAKMSVILVLVVSVAVLVGSGQEASGGTLAAWGISDGSTYDLGQVSEMPAGSDFVAVEGGKFHSLALKSDGSLAAWGWNGFRQCNVSAGNDFVAIAAGGYHSLALRHDGSLVAWGNNGYGQLNVPAGNDFVAIAAGEYHSLALKSDGSLAAWGWNPNGQCDVPAGNDFVAIAADARHNVAIKSDGSLAAWGLNRNGQCDVPAGNDFVAIAAGAAHSLALKSDGSLAAWGYNHYGQCDVPAGNDFVAIAAGAVHSLALKSDGSLAAWGDNEFSQCNVPAGNDFVAVAAGLYHNLAIAGGQPMGTEPMGTAITHHGRLMDKNRPADGLYDLQFNLYDSNDPFTGTQLASPIDIYDLDVIDGLFVVELDFGSGIFDGNAVWLETRIVRSPIGSDPTVLNPLLELTPTPYALYAASAGTLSDWTISGWDAVLHSSDTSGRGHDLIGNYEGWDPNAVYIAGYNAKNAQDRATKRVIFGGYGSETAIVDIETGKVGIGTTSPSNKLSVEGDRFFRTSIRTHVNASNSPGVLQIGFSRGTGSSPSAVLGGNTIGYLEFAGFNGTSHKVAAWIRAVARENFTSSASGTDLEFMTHEIGTNLNMPRMTIKDNGNVGIGITSTSYKLHTNGTSYAVRRAGSGIDIAEYILDTKGDTEAGDVLAADPDNDESAIKSSIPYDSAVVGIVSTQPHMLIGLDLFMDEETGEMYEDVNAAMLALAGRVPVKVTDENGPIERGDLLTTSSKSGYAMKWQLLDVNQAEDFDELKSMLAENERRRNAVVGKALGNLDSGDGKIVALVNLQ